MSRKPAASPKDPSPTDASPRSPPLLYYHVLAPFANIRLPLSPDYELPCQVNVGVGETEPPPGLRFGVMTPCLSSDAGSAAPALPPHPQGQGPWLSLPATRLYHLSGT